MAITTFIPELWNARLIYALDKAHVAAGLVNRNYEGQITKMGDTVHINSIGAITINSYTKNTDIAAPETLTTTDQELVIDQGKYFNFQVDDVDKAQAAGEIIDVAMGRAAYGLADVADKFLLSTMAAGADAGNIIGTSAAATALTAANVYENVIDLRILLDKANVPTSGRFIVVPPEVYGLLLQDERFVKASDTNAATARNGLVGSVGA
jgi:P22 coat protein - gene protein 5.